MIISKSIHPKGWGEEEWIVNNDLYCGKILRFRAGLRCSLHYHLLKTETMFVSSGLGVMRFGVNHDSLDSLELKDGLVFHIEPGLLHQIIATTDLEIIEFSTQHFESDSYRVVKGD